MALQFFSRLTRGIWPGTIRLRLSLIIVFAVVTLATMRLVNLAHEGEHAIAKARSQAIELAKAGVMSGLDVVDQARMSTDILAQVPALLTGTPAECSLLLADVQRTRPWAVGFHVLDTTGMIVCSSARETIGVNLADRPYVQQAIARGEFVAGDFIVGRQSGVPMIGSAMPVFGKSGELRRVIVATISTKWFSKLATELAAANHGSSITLIDGSGIVLADAPESSERVGSPLESESMRAGLERMQDSSFDAAGNDGQRRIYGVAALPDSNALLLIGLSYADVESSIVRSRQQALAELALLIVLMGAAIWVFGSRSLERPIRQLLVHTRQIGRGRLEARLDSSRWPRELAMLAQTMNLMAARLERRNSQLHVAQEKLRRQTLTDPLTNLANRRAFDDHFADMWKDAYTGQTPLSLAIIDADYFKGYNDTYGHVAGDAVLQQLAGVLSQMAKASSGVAARLGGEEFAMLLPGLDEHEALGLADRVCIAVSDLFVEHAGAPLENFTVSIGVAGLIPQGKDVDRLLLRSADAALYAAKASGRNRALGSARLGALAVDQSQPKWLKLAR